MSFDKAVDLYRSVYRRFQKIEGRPWGAEGNVMELLKQCGELAKYVMIKEGYYFSGRENLPGYQVNREKLGDELADIMAQLIRIADYYEIDLQSAFLRAREEEIASLGKMGA